MTPGRRRAGLGLARFVFRAFRCTGECERMRRRRISFSPHGDRRPQSQCTIQTRSRTRSVWPVLSPFLCNLTLTANGLSAPGRLCRPLTELPVPAVVTKVRPSVVTVLTRGIPPGGSQHAPSGSGSGIILDTNGYIPPIITSFRGRDQCRGIICGQADPRTCRRP